MENVEIVKIEEICSFICSGGTPKSTNPDFYNGEIPWLNTNEVNFNKIYSTSRYISENGLHNSSAKYVPLNTVIVAMYGVTAGKCAIAKIPLTTNQACCNLIIDPQKADYRYVYQFLKMQHRVLNSLATGGAQQNLNSLDIKRFKMPLPNINIQSKIADILFAYDDLIEANNRRIEFLEQTAQELYKEWFVRFRFPGHENAKFENGLPEGWELKKIGDIARVKSGYAFKSEWWIDEGVPVIKIKDIQGNTIDFNDLSHVSVEHAEIAKQFYVVEGDLLIAMTGATIGKMALVPYSEKQLVVNQRVGKFFLGENPAENVSFLYMTLQQNWVQELIVMIAGSNAAQPNISPFDIEKIKIVYNKNMVDEYNRRSAAFINQILQLRKQNQNLAAQRDMLLPRLMSGKLEV